MNTATPQPVKWALLIDGKPMFADALELFDSEADAQECAAAMKKARALARKTYEVVGVYLGTPPSSPAPERDHTVEIFPENMDRLRAWMESPNGALCSARIIFESVEGGGILVRTSPYRP